MKKFLPAMYTSAAYSYARILNDAILNAAIRRTSDILYITEPADWAIRAIAQAITSRMAQFSAAAHVSTTPLCATVRLVHYGSPHVLGSLGSKIELHQSAARVLTVYHLMPESDTVERIRTLLPRINKVHTACQSTRRQLVAAGINESKITVIPIGVDDSLFRRPTPLERESTRAAWDIPPDHIVIGSFQKDGQGWSQGMEPKLIKGPDIFINTVEQLSRKYPIFILLSGPARGYVISELEKRRIPFRYTGHQPSLPDVAKLYRALDLYIISSRLEGGPQQLFEAWASGVPVVSTPVGMVPDVAVHDKTAVIAESAALAEAAAGLLARPDAASAMAAAAHKHVQRYTWNRLAKTYYDSLYAPFLSL